MDKMQNGMTVMALAAAFMVSTNPRPAEAAPDAGAVARADYGRLPLPLPEDTPRGPSHNNTAFLAGRRYELPEPPVKKIRLGRPR